MRASACRVLAEAGPLVMVHRPGRDCRYALQGRIPRLAQHRILPILSVGVPDALRRPYRPFFHARGTPEGLLSHQRPAGTLWLSADPFPAP